MSRYFLSIGFTSILLLASTVVWAEDRIVVSIKPLQLIATEIVGDRGRVDVLINSRGSPHDYALKISDIKKLRSADLVIWLSPHLETFLAKPIEQLKVANLKLINIEGDGVNKHHHHVRLDPHVWLNPIATIGLAEAIRIG
ncbi:MAG: zinc ABC transporter substrate-binding protein [Pseudomonadales bacterium]|nr:zinc ABC transporter substrate-binding protein [Pseudomonadales bacterium]